MLTDDFTIVDTSKPICWPSDRTKLVQNQDRLETLMHSIKNGEAFGTTLESALLECMNHIILLSKEITSRQGVI